MFTLWGSAGISTDMNRREFASNPFFSCTAMLFLFIICSRVWKAFSILLFITHKRGAQKNTGDLNHSAEMFGSTSQALHAFSVLSLSTMIQPPQSFQHRLSLN